MYLAYLDESGDTGHINSPSDFFVLGCTFIHESSWLTTLDKLLIQRRQIAQNYKIPVRSELKSRHIRRGTGPLQNSKWSAFWRIKFYEQLIEYQAVNLDVKSLVVAINKAKAVSRGRTNIRELAWTFAFQRINRFCGQSDWAIIFPDAGHGFFIRTLLRKMRRFHSIPKHWGTGSIKFPTQRIVEDPNERDSQDSYFIQLVDWNCYAAHRSKYVAPSSRFPSDLWDKLGSTILTHVNQVTGGPPGIVVYPR